MGIKAILLQKQDDVVTLTRKAEPGEKIVWQEEGIENEIKVWEEIPIYHKAACKEIKKGEPIHKYGEIIGIALSDIKPGQWVHTGNLKSVSMMEEIKQAEQREKECKG